MKQIKHSFQRQLNITNNLTHASLYYSNFQLLSYFMQVTVDLLEITINFIYLQFINLIIQHYQFKLMGICQSDPLTYLIKEYGGEVCKFIVAEKSEDFVQDTAPKIKERAKEQVENATKDIHKTMDDKQKTIDTNFKTTVNDLNSSDPDAIKKATTASGKSTQEMLGLNSMKSEVGKIKSEADKKIGTQSEGIMKTIDEQKQKMKKQIKDNKPSLPLYQNMPICLKQKVLGDGKQKFAGEIKSSEQKITKTFQTATNMDGISKNLKSISGADRVGQIADDSKSTFQKAKKMMTMSKGGCFGN